MSLTSKAKSTLSMSWNTAYWMHNLEMLTGLHRLNGCRPILQKTNIETDKS